MRCILKRLSLLAGLRLQSPRPGRSEVAQVHLKGRPSPMRGQLRRPTSLALPISDCSHLIVGESMNLLRSAAGRNLQEETSPIRLCMRGVLKPY